MLASYIQYPSFWEQIFRNLVIMNEQLFPWWRKKKDPWFFDHVFVPAEYYQKNIDIFNEKLTNGLFSL